MQNENADGKLKLSQHFWEDNIHALIRKLRIQYHMYNYLCNENTENMNEDLYMRMHCFKYNLHAKDTSIYISS